MRYINVIRGFFLKCFKKINSHGLFSVGCNSHIRGGKFINVGRNFNAGNDFWLEAISSYFKNDYCPSIKIGKNFIANNSNHIAAVNEIIIGDDVLIGSYVLITDHAHGIYNNDPTFTQTSPLTRPCSRELSKGYISIGDRVWIGDKVSIVGKVKIGSGVVIAANSVVVHDVENDVIIAGSPAVIIKKWNGHEQKWERYKSVNH